ncbi:hypothetical protein BDW75DRAFT_238260 [Aspergillus navahoensis]
MVAGITLPDVAGSNTSVYAAVFSRDYRDGIVRDADNLPRFLSTGTGDAMLSNRVSHFYDLRGPSFTVDTGCSGGLVAFHEGVKSLRLGESDMSLICGASLLLNPDMFKALSSVGLLSPDGKSYAFDSRANGFGRGEGIATLVIKRLSDAIISGDPIRAIVRESGLNQDGKTETITTPSEEAQVALMRDCYRRAGATIECRAIATVFKDGRSADNPLRIGSVKTNVGHTEAVSGLASLIKVVLALEKGKIPPIADFKTPNPSIHFKDLRLRVVTELEDWPPGPGGVRRASINNFGYGGTNGHLIVESAPRPQLPANADAHTLSATHLESQLLVFSARDEQACQNMISNFKQYLHQRAATDDPEDLLQHIAHTLGQHRTLFPWVAARPVPVQEGLKEAIRALEFPMLAPRRTTRVPRIGMIFTGQGAQWYAMGYELIAAYPVFKSSLKEIDRYLSELGAGWSAIRELSKNAASSRVNEVEYSTPLCTAVQISLVHLLRSWGVKPVAVTSHSSGEIAAAYAVGALSCQDAMAVAYHRALLASDKHLQVGSQGAMVVLGMGAQKAKSYLARLDAKHGVASVACVNSPVCTTVSGDKEAVAAVEALARENGIYTQLLKIQTAFHSHHMTPIEGPYRSVLQTLLAPSKCHEHLVDSLLQPVQFVDAFTDMLLGNADSSGANVDVILEVGPHTALGSPVRQILAQPDFASLDLPYFGCLVRGTSAVASMHSLAASLLAEGLPLNMGAVNFPLGRYPAVRVLSDLPSYPWNHQTRHWHESRFNKALRERSQPPHDLLGSLVLGTDISNPSWRQILRLRDTPWVRQHVVQNNILYPAAGFICLAIEAIKQQSVLQSSDKKAVSGYLLRDIDFMRALVVPDNDDGVEVQTSLRQVIDKEIGVRGWKQFEISSVTPDNQWTIHARGFITAQLEDAPDKFIPKSRPAGLAGYIRRFKPNKLYRALHSMGISHGEIFRIITDIEQAGNCERSASRLFIPQTALPTDLPNSILLHPITLDGVMQTIYTPALENNGNRDGKVPRSIGSIWVSSNINNAVGHGFRAFTTLHHADVQILRADITIADDQNMTALPVLEIRHAVCQSLGRGPSMQISGGQWEKEPYLKVEWAPDASLMSTRAHEQTKEQLSHPVSPEEVRHLIDLRRICLYFILDSLTSLTSTDLERLQSHHVKFHSWMRLQVQLAAEGRLAPGSEHWLEDTLEQRQTLIAHVRRTSVNGKMVCRLGPHLTAILCQEKTALELMMEENLLNRYYQDALKCDRSLPQAANLLANLVHKNPRARILEIGAGTGGLTRYILPKIGTNQTGGPLAELYHFTDISPAFFGAARDEFTPWSDIMLFDKLDIETDPACQGFELESYDIVIAAQVLHATTSISKTIFHVHRLMKPGGTLLLVETTQDQVDSQFVFGLLPGWWLSEEPQRALSPSLSSSFWDERLRASGFSGVDFEVRDCESDEWFMMSVITSTAEPDPRLSTQVSGPVVIVQRKDAPCDQPWMEALRAALAAGGQVPELADLETATAGSYQGKWVLFLAEVDKPLLHSLDPATLPCIQSMFTHCRGVLWVTRGGAVNCERPDLSLAAGFLRSIRHEYVGRKYVNIDLDPNSKLWSDASLKAITQVVIASFGSCECPARISPPYEYEYAEREGIVLVPRLHRDSARNKAFNPEPVDWASPESLPIESLFQSDRPLALKVGVPGLLDTLVFDDHPTAPAEESRFPSDLIEIEPRAFGVNFCDVLVAMGQLEERVMGVDCAGVITRVGGRAAAHGYAVGDQVFALLHRGGYGSRASVEWTNVMHMPPGLNFEQAASLPALFTTGYICLYKVARLQLGQTVLIHAGAGGMGQTSIQFAQLIGAEVYTTVGSPEKRQLLMERYGIPKNHIFSSRDASFAEGILKATNGRGVDLVLNSLSGPLLQESLNIVAPFGHFGHFIELGKRDIEQNNYLEMQPFSRHITFSSFDMVALSLHDGSLVHLVLAEISRLLGLGVLSPVYPIVTFSLGEIGKALRQLQSGKHSGKIVLSVSPQERVRVVPKVRAARLRSDASYLLVGGAGGIGRSMAHWLVSHGARNLIVLSRGAETSPAAVALAAELDALGCRVKIISCDASAKAELSKAIESCSMDLPPVRGVIHSAMVLQDAVFERMTFDDWQTPLRPKVKGSWNLHNEFRTTDLDFFIFLSSMSGIYGYTTQLSYAAGNTFQDALAHWRVSQGLPALSLDLGPVEAVGYVAGTDGVTERMTRIGLYPVTEDQVLGALESAVLSPFDKQIALGINQGPGPHWDPEDVSWLGRDARFTSLQYRKNTHHQVTECSDGPGSSLTNQLSDARTWVEAQSFVVAAIASKLADIFMIPVAHIDITKHISEYGLDSLGAVELRNMLALQAAADMSIFSIMQSESLIALASEVTRKSTLVPSSLLAI